MRRLALMTICTCLCGCAQQPKDDLPTEVLHRVVDAERPTLKPCYERALEARPYEHSIEMRAIISIEPSGKVDEVEIEGEGLPGMPAYLEKVIAGWSFPKAGDATHTSLPLIFRPEVKKTPDLQGLFQ